MKDVHFKVGMTCGGCSKAVTKVLSKVEGIEIVEISVENKDVKIKIPDDMEASTCEEALKKWSVASGKSVELIV